MVSFMLNDSREFNEIHLLDKKIRKIHLRKYYSIRFLNALTLSYDYSPCYDFTLLPSDFQLNMKWLRNCDLKHEIFIILIILLFFAKKNIVGTRPKGGGLSRLTLCIFSLFSILKDKILLIVNKSQSIPKRL